MSRWLASVEYRTEQGVIDVLHVIEELDELQDLIERGPNWYTLVKVTITLKDADEQLTVEKAEQL